MKQRLFRACLLTACLAGGLAARSSAQLGTPPFRVDAYPLNSGLHDGNGSQASLAFEHTVFVPDAAWLRLRFEDANLGRGSWLAFHAPRTGDTQELDSRSFADWYRATAMFNGNALTVQLWVGPHDTDVFFDLHQAVVGVFGDGSYENLCGSDSRVASSDNRVCRIPSIGCTAWRITNGAFLTAGHCVDIDPDCTTLSDGPLLPDGVLDLVGVVEFNVPASACNGAINMSVAGDQYPIDLASVVWRYDGCNTGGIGKDWAVFGVNPNSQTGLLPHEGYGFPLRISRETPSIGSSIRITGFGTDNTPTGCTGGRNSANQTNQTSTGDYRGEFVTNANQIALEYGTDSMGGNSGGPVIWTAQNLAIGVHTNGGCNGTGAGDQGNSATSFEVDQLEQAIRNFTPGSTERFVDVGHPRPGGFEDGGIYRPWDRITDALASPVSGQTVSIAAGDYTAASGHVFTITTAMTLEAPVGAVTIGD